MPSNSLSSRRLMLRRPKVCWWTAGSSPCAPPVCSIEPDLYNLSWSETTNVRFYARAGEYVYPTVVSVETVADDGLFEPPPVLFNDTDGDGAYVAPNATGLFLLVATFTWPNGETCKASTKIYVEF
jgi:hypothetical protein